MARRTNRCRKTWPTSCGGDCPSATCAERFALFAARQRRPKIAGSIGKPSSTRCGRARSPFWGALCAADRRRFVQHLRPYWDVHRHRLPPATAERLAQTLRSWLLHQGRRDEVAADLVVHPQTVRYRMGQLRELYGDRLLDPLFVRALTIAL